MISLLGQKAPFNVSDKPAGSKGAGSEKLKCCLVACSSFSHAGLCFTRPGINRMRAFGKSMQTDPLNTSVYIGRAHRKNSAVRYSSPKYRAHHWQKILPLNEWILERIIDVSEEFVAESMDYLRLTELSRGSVNSPGYSTHNHYFFPGWVNRPRNQQIPPVILLRLSKSYLGWG